MKFISKAPFRIGLAGGGTDVSPYSEMYGGTILNATVDLYATVVIIPRTDGKVIFDARNEGVKVEVEAKEVLEDIPGLTLQIGVYNHIVKNFAKKPLSCELITTIDVPSGSGLGTSSTIVVALIGAFREWLNLPLGEYDIAQLALTIERSELQMLGGKQDQYAATFGGFNFMEFQKDNRVIVNPLRVKSEVIKELEYHLLLFYTKTKRESSNIISKQKENFEKSKKTVIEASHQLKAQAFKMKEAVLMNDLYQIGALLNLGWENKKQLAKGITNKKIEDIYNAAIEAGSTGGKISGAGGGGFMIFYCPKNTRFKVIDALEAMGIMHQRYTFQKNGLETWSSKQ